MRAPEPQVGGWVILAVDRSSRQERLDLVIHLAMAKVSEDERSVVYRSGPRDSCTGLAELDKGAVTVTDVSAAV